MPTTPSQHTKDLLGIEIARNADLLRMTTTCIKDLTRQLDNHIATRDKVLERLEGYRTDYAALYGEEWHPAEQSAE